MKHLLFFICLTFSLSSFAQSTKWVKNRVAPTLTETSEHVYSNLSGKKLKNGECFIMDISNNELARGKYKEGKKDSVWNYYNTAGDLIQVYDYTNAKLIYNVPDRKTIVQEAYVVDTTGYVNAKITTPKKLGGVNYGFYLLFNERNLPSAVKQQTDKMLMEYVFSLSETGKVENVSINYTSRFYNTENPQSIDSSVPDAYEFLPATINGKPVKSKFIYQIVMEVSQARDRNLYAIPTQGKQ